MEQPKIPNEESAVASGICVKCKRRTLINRGGRCLACFTDGTLSGLERNVNTSVLPRMNRDGAKS